MKKTLNLIFIIVGIFSAFMFISGLFNMITFFGVLKVQPKTLMHDKLKEYFTPISIVSFIIALISLGIIITLIVKNHKCNAPPLIIALSILLIIASIIMIFVVNRVGGYLDFLTNNYSANSPSLAYTDFTVQQMLDSVNKNLFVPVTIMSGMLIAKTIIDAKNVSEEK